MKMPSITKKVKTINNVINVMPTFNKIKLRFIRILEGVNVMQITSVTVRKIEKDGSRMKGIATVLLDDAFAVHDIRVIEGDNGLFIAMPSRKTATGGYRDIAHPINPDVRKQFEDAIIEEYNKAA